MRLLSKPEREALGRIVENEHDTVQALEALTLPALTLVRDAAYDLHRLTSNMASSRERAAAAPATGHDTCPGGC